MKEEWKRILNYVVTQKTKSHRAKTDFRNTRALKFHVFFVSDPFFGLSSNLNIRFNSIFDNELIRNKILYIFEVLRLLQAKL